MFKKLFVLALILVAATGWCVGSSTLDLGDTIFRRPLVLVTASIAANVSIADGTISSITLNIEKFDPDNLWDGVATFTAPTDGIYKFSGMFRLDAAGTYVSLRVYYFINGAYVTEDYIQSSGAGGWAGFQYCRRPVLFSPWLNAGDKVSFRFKPVGSACIIYDASYLEYDTFLLIERVYPN